MAKYGLTISSDDPNEIARILAHLGGSQVSVAALNAGAGDDDNGPVNASATAVDVTGIPHDERIHAKAKTQNADGSWRKKKGVAETTVQQVEAELKSRMISNATAQPQVQQPPQQQYAPPQSGQPQFAQPQVQQPPQQQYAPPQQPEQPQYAQPQVPQQQYAPQPQQAQPPVQQYAPQPQPQQPAQQPAQSSEMNSFMTGLQAGMKVLGSDGKALINPEYLAWVCQQLTQAFPATPINSITDVEGHSNVINYAIEMMKTHQRWVA